MTAHPGGEFAEGLEAAGRVVAHLSVQDPLLLRAVASEVEATARSGFDLGVACGYRLLADELEEGAVMRMP